MKINEFVGRFLKQYRTDHGLTMDDVATASQRYGSGWSSGTISQMEHGGSKADSLPVLLMLVQSLNDLTHDTLTVAGLFKRTAEWNLPITITDAVTMSPGELAESLTVGDVPLMPNITDAGMRHMEIFTQDVRSGLIPSSKHTRLFPPTPLRVSTIIPTASEARAANKIHRDPLEFAVWCRHLYGRSMDEEAASRAGKGATPQKRGRYSRQIIQEVNNRIEGELNDLRIIEAHNKARRLNSTSSEHA